MAVGSNDSGNDSGQWNKLSRAEFKTRVRAVHVSMDGRAYTRTWLAEQLGIDRKTLVKYLGRYDVGWPPFATEAEYELTIRDDGPGRGTIVAASNATCAVLGYTRAELVESNYNGKLHPGERNTRQTRPEVVAAVQGLKQNPEAVYEFEEDWRTRDGERLELWARIQWVPEAAVWVMRCRLLHAVLTALVLAGIGLFIADGMDGRVDGVIDWCKLLIHALGQNLRVD